MQTQNHQRDSSIEPYFKGNTFLTVTEHFIQQQHTDSHQNLEDRAVKPQIKTQQLQLYSDYERLKLQSKNNRGNGK